MRSMVEITTYDKKTYRITEERAAIVNEAMEAGDSHVLLQGIATLAIKNISSMEPIQVPDDVAAVELELPAMIDLQVIDPQNEHQARWIKLLRINAHSIKAKKQLYEPVALLRNLDDLDRYEGVHVLVAALGEAELPILALAFAEIAPDDVVEYAPANTWRSSEPVDSVRCIWVKRRLSRGEYQRYYAAHPGYYKLRDDGDDHVLIGQRYVTEGKALPNHLEACDPSESKRLEWLVGRR